MSCKKEWKENDKPVVYFIQAENGLIKIGKSANPFSRLEGMRVQSPLALELIGLTADFEESVLHSRFLLLRHHGEWFRPDKELLDFIKSNAENPLAMVPPERLGAIGDDEFEKLVKACAEDESPLGRRDCALIYLLKHPVRNGHQLARMRVYDYNPRRGEVCMYKYGNKMWWEICKQQAVAALNAWLQVRGTDAGPMFTRIGKGGRMSYDGITGQAILLAVRQRANEAGLQISARDLTRQNLLTSEDLERACSMIDVPL